MNLNRILGLSAVALAFICVSFHFGPYAGFLAAFCMAALLTPVRRATLRSNSIDSELNLDTILDSAIRAFAAAVLPLTMFATVFRNVQLKGTNKVQVPYYPLDTSAGTDFDYGDGYVFDDSSSTEHREVVIDRRKYVPMRLTGEELARYPALNAEKLGAMKGERLAYLVIQDILSVVNAANFGGAIFTGIASGFDSDDVQDVATVLDGIPWPKAGRGLLLNPTYNGALFKDSDVKLAYAYGDNGVIKDGKLPRLLGFDYGSSAAIPANGENLVGMATYMSAILAAFSPIAPPPAARKMMSAYEIAVDPATQIALEYREWGDPDGDADKRVIECNYGFGKGEANALKRFVSA